MKLEEYGKVIDGATDGPRTKTIIVTDCGTCPHYMPAPSYGWDDSQCRAKGGRDIHPCRGAPMHKECPLPNSQDPTTDPIVARAFLDVAKAAIAYVTVPFDIAQEEHMKLLGKMNCALKQLIEALEKK